MLANENICPICFDKCDAWSAECIDTRHSHICNSCLAAYVQHKINSDHMGYCTPLFCPCQHQYEIKSIRPILSFKDMVAAGVIPLELASLRKQQAASLLSFLCSGCHNIRSLAFVDYEAKTIEEAKLQISKIVQCPSKQKYLFDNLRQLETGLISVEQFYNYSMNSLSIYSYNIHDDRKAWEIYKNVIISISDPERRCSLQLRYLRGRPRIWTPCCSKDHCFWCKTKDFHFDKTCEENVITLDSNHIECPSCQISLVKGDGCNSVTCVCGQMFSWNAEVETKRRISSFKQNYPLNTAAKCAEILCSSKTDDISEARAWMSKHKSEVDFELLKWWKLMTHPAESQACALPANLPVSDGESEARILWEQMHPREVANCRKSIQLSIKELFNTFFHTKSEKAAGAFWILHGKSKNNLSRNIFSQANTSALLWKEENLVQYQQECEAQERRLACQFLTIYGSRRPSISEILAGQTSAAIQWNIAISNPALNFTENNTIVERPGGVSSYPAAFASLPCHHCMFSVIITKCHRGPNWLTFGLAKVGMPFASSDGVGRTLNTWGICDDRSSTNGRCKFYSCGREVKTFRKLQLNDVLTVEVDSREGWGTISINEDEIEYYFEIPVGTPPDQLYFAMTFANDHQVKILVGSSCCGDIERRQKEFNEENLERLKALKQHMSKVADGQVETIDSMVAETFEDKDIHLAKARPFLDYLTGHSNELNTSKDRRTKCPYSWKELYSLNTWSVNTEKGAESPSHPKS